MDKLLKEIKEIEFSKIQYNKESEDYYEYKEGKIPILVSAPHGARHLRDGSWKEEDEYTAAIAIKLAELTDAHVIYVKNATKEDSNHDLETKFKDKIREIVKEHGIKFIADLHGANSKRPFKVSVGIINDETEKCSCPSFKEIIQETFKTFQNDIFNLCNFSASKPGTVTSFAKSILNIEAAQFEINAKYRIVDRKPDSSYSKKDMDSEYKADENHVIELLSYFEEMLLRINKIIEKGLNSDLFHGEKLDKTKLSSTVTVRKYRNMVNDQDKDGIANFLYERFSERYIVPLKNVPLNKKNGFIIMAVGCFMIETFESFQHGWPITNGKILYNGKKIGKGKAAFRYFFNRYEQFSEFKNFEDDFYKNVRCGILHQSETTNGWRILRSGPLFIKESKTINATIFLNRLDKCLNIYCDKLRESEWESEIWKNLRKKVNSICKNCKPT